MGHFGVILGLLWVYEGGFGSLLGYFEIALGVVAGLMASGSAPNGPISSKYTFLQGFLKGQGIHEEIQKTNTRASRGRF